MDERASRAGDRRAHPRACDQHLHGYRDRQHHGVRGPRQGRPRCADRNRIARLSPAARRTRAMPKFAANLTMLFNEMDFMDRFGAAAKAGFRGVEYLFPYPYPKEALAEALSRNGLIQVLHNLPAGDWTNGERGITCLPGREGEFQDGVGKAIEYARVLKCTKLNCLVGISPAGVDRAR